MHYWRAILVHSTFLLAQPVYLTIRYLLNRDYFSKASTVWLAVGAISWIYIVTQITIPFFRNPLRHLPSPPNEKFPLCHLDFNGGKPPMDNISAMLKNTPNDGLIAIWFPFYLSCELITTRPETFLDVLNTHNYDWEKPTAVRKFLAKVLGEGLVNVEGPTHKSMRRAVAPAFSGRHIRDLVPLFYSKGLAFADALAKDVNSSPDGILEITKQMSRVTLDIIGAAGVGKDFNTIKHDDDLLANLYATITSSEGRGPLIIFFLIFSLLPQWLIKNLKGTPYARIANAQIQLRREAKALMREKKQILQDKPEQQNDIISIIMRSGDFSDDYLVDQLLTFLAAGHDTTASALSWVTWLLSRNPVIQDRLRIECYAHLAGVATPEIDASIFDAKTMPYLTAVCNETLRLYPGAVASGRHAVKPTKIGSQYVPKDTSVMIPIWAINRNEGLWGSDAETFNPRRWLSGANAANGGATSPYALLTFLHGPRSCIGQSFAFTEMKCLLAVLIMRFRFELADVHDNIEPGGYPIIKPQPELRLRLHDLKAGSQAKS